VPYVNANPTPATELLPASFYLSGKPSFLTSIRVSAPVSAIGPMVTGGPGPGGFSYPIPAAELLLQYLVGPSNGSVVCCRSMRPLLQRRGISCGASRPDEPHRRCSLIWRDTPHWPVDGADFVVPGFPARPGHNLFLECTCERSRGVCHGLASRP